MVNAFCKKCLANLIEPVLGTGVLPWDTTQELGQTVGQLGGGGAALCVLQHRLGWEPRS